MSDQAYTDLALTRRSFEQLTSDREQTDIVVQGGGDLQTVGGRESLAQAIINRLLTRKGELAKLGHPAYGSRLHLLAGEPNNVRTQARADFYLRECLAQESRIEEVRFIEFAVPNRLDTRSTLQVSIGIRPKESTQLLLLDIPLNL